MSKNIQLHIPKPCHENWNNMTPIEKGRFCGSCQKQVVDFTGMSDEQMIAFFRKPANGSTCGRFMKDQLDRSIKVPKKRLPWVRYFFQIALPAFLASSKATAQGKVVLTGDTVIVSTPKLIVMGNAFIPDTIKKEIRGTLIDDNGESIPYASVLIKGTKIITVTDTSGNFSLKYKGKEDSCVLVTSCIGFTAKETIVMLNNKVQNFTISMTSDVVYPDVVMGMIMTEIADVSFPPIIEEDTASSIDTMLSKKIPSEQSLPSSVYPNPIKKNSALTIQMDHREKGAYIFQLIGINGQVILNREFWVDENSLVIKMHIPSLSSGTYFLRKRNKLTNKSYTEKIIVE